ncbi:MAG: O-sialoglycoprotein endopeptidase [Parcubacteria group bacterium Gr01-1014_18]|nr:MAG: O-sialoglycoprotein endopeptidase [Parcubacteria group bacterium Greene0416_36]TSC81531.1 MAG: O-sialoglycoprotein endopeptidase [Parcubacteria group bacterium Gr01-1014_18]TSC99658.1 MAG: O-sialoglycoprotein endopeptidase [Parcubacteria group bacterium Greene1014_20]TSD07109.1 MAG: O-sialoglycoprotein endopeptidase [Parcubacteria group bacterium Greene0714_2]
MYILAIDTSCDDTSVAILKDDCLLSSVVSSQVEIHKQWGGVVPNLARMEHEKNIGPCIELAIRKSGLVGAHLHVRPTLSSGEEQGRHSGLPLHLIDAIAVTYGPGLAPALQVGVKKAKELAIEYNKPLIAVNHIEGHIFSALIKNRKGNFYTKNAGLEYPFLSLIVSGGHTEIVWVDDIGKYTILGRTLDDAAGEALDKIARLLGLGYPGGAVVEHFAKSGNRKAYDLPRPMKTKDDLNFSFSGLKTSCLYQIQKLEAELKENFKKIVPDYCASLQEAVFDILWIKLEKTLKTHKPKMITVGGGVSVNLELRRKLRRGMKDYPEIPILFSDPKFCMDNAAMIGFVGYYLYLRKKYVININSLDRKPTLSLAGCGEAFEPKK